MAIRPDYVTGTITLTSGSSNFTTSGSALQAAAVQAGDEIITRSGNVLIIANITGQNSGTLMQPCPASAAGAAQPLRIRYQPDGSRYQGAARDLISRWGDSGNVDALAGLAGENGKLPIFTGAGTMGLVDEGDVGIKDPNGNLGELAGLALVANRLITTASNGTIALSSEIPNALLPGRLAEVTTLVSNINSLRTSGWYRANASATGVPEAAEFTILHIQTSVDGANQFAFRRSSNRGYARRLQGGVWSSFEVTSIEFGSNPLGSYLRFPGGFQVCWLSSASSFSVQTATGPVFQSGEIAWTFPAAFSTADVAGFVSSYGSSARWGGNILSTTATNMTFRVFSAVSQTATLPAQCMAIGSY